MLPVQRSSLSGCLSWFNLSAVVSSFQAWVRREVVDDDPWDDETLHPDSSILLLEESASEEPNSEKSNF